MEDLPNESAQPMRYAEIALLMSHFWPIIAEIGLAFEYLLSQCGVRLVIDREPMQGAIPLGRAVAVGFSCALLASRTDADPGRELGG
jgi:hypothetical protein